MVNDDDDDDLQFTSDNPRTNHPHNRGIVICAQLFTFRIGFLSYQGKNTPQNRVVVM